MTSTRYDSLLSSLASELAFNDLRDAGKRSRKSQKVEPQDLHAVASKSACRRNMGCAVLDVMESDWGLPMDKKHVKTAVFNGFRQSDTHLGVSSDGLTRHKSNHILTKPHIFTQRLELFDELFEVYQSESGSAEEKVQAVEHAFQKGWVAQLV